MKCELNVNKAPAEIVTVLYITPSDCKTNLAV